MAKRETIRISGPAIREEIVDAKSLRREMGIECRANGFTIKAGELSLSRLLGLVHPDNRVMYAGKMMDLRMINDMDYIQVCNEYKIWQHN